MRERPRLLVAESRGFSADALARLRPRADVELAELDRAALLARIGEADVLWTRLRHQIDAEVLDAAPGLGAVATPTTGLTHVDTAAADRRGVAVLSLRDLTARLTDVRATAEHTIGLMLALLRHLPAAVAHARDGGWHRDRFEGRELYGRTVGVVGYGRLGRIVGRYLNAFGAHVLAADPALASAPSDADVEAVSLTDLLRRAEIVTLHASLTPATYGLIGRTELALMPEGAWLINTARGELLDEEALVDALRSGRIAGAALDVLAGERADGMGTHPLVRYARAHENLLITPHLGGCTVDSLAKAEVLLAAQLADWLGAFRRPSAAGRQVPR